MSKTTTIADLVAAGVLSLGDGYRTKQSELRTDGFRIIRVADIRGGRIALDSPDFVSAEYARQIGSKAAQAGDVLLTTKGTVGRVAIVPDLTQDAVYSPQLCWFRVHGHEHLSARFLSYWLSSAEFTSQASHLQGNTDMAPYISLFDLRKSSITLPVREEQEAIADVLGALDDKIASNNWLIESADMLMHQTFVSAAPSIRVPLSSTASFVNGKAFTKGASGSGRVVVRIAELNSGLSGSTVFSDAIVADQHVARAGDILFAWSGSLTLHRWFRDDAIVNQHIFKVIPNPETPAWLSYELIRSKLDDFKGTAADKATTMGHIQRHHLDELVSVPSRETIAHLSPAMEALWHLALNAERENLTLAATRDTLLPQLLSGRLRIRDTK